MFEEERNEDMFGENTDVSSGGADTGTDSTADYNSYSGVSDENQKTDDTADVSGEDGETSGSSPEREDVFERVFNSMDQAVSADEKSTDSAEDTSKDDSTAGKTEPLHGDVEDSTDTDKNYSDGNYYDSFNTSYEKKDEPDKKKSSSRRLNIVIGCVVALAVIVVVICSVQIISGLRSGTFSAGSGTVDIGSTETIDDDDDDDTLEDSDYDTIDDTDTSDTSQIIVADYSDIVEAVMPSIVAITSTEYADSSDYFDIYDYYFGDGSSSDEDDEMIASQSAGSGIIIDQTDTELLIVTNNHMVEDEDSFEVQFNGAGSDETAEAYVKGTDQEHDIAVLAVKLEDISEETLGLIKKATLGDSDELEVGESVVAIGNALGYGQSVTAGIVSAIRDVTLYNDSTVQMIQTDAAINGGNSGGALINSKGEVIGINEMKYSSTSTTEASIEGMGFAIPISDVTDIIDELKTQTARTKVDDEERGYLGITGLDVDETTANSYGMPEGVFVYSVAEGSGSEKAGLEARNIIVEFDGTTITSMSDLQDKLEYYSAGETVDVKIAYADGNDYSYKTISITLDDSSILDGLDTGSSDSSSSGSGSSDYYYGYNYSDSYEYSNSYQ